MSSMCVYMQWWIQGLGGRGGGGIEGSLGSKEPFVRKNGCGLVMEIAEKSPPL